MNKYLKKSLHYFAGNLFNKALLFFFLPIFTHFMVPSEYAIYTNFLIFIAFASLIYLLGIQQALFSYFHEESTNEYKHNLISSIFVVVIILGIVLSILILFNRDLISQLIVRDKAYGYLIPFIVIIIFSGSIYGITLSILNMMERSVNYAILGGVKNSVLLILFLYGSITSQFNVYTVFLFMTISSIISGFIALINIGKILRNLDDGSFRPKIFSFELIRPVIRFGIIMIPGTFAMLILRVIDRYMLTYLSVGGLHDVGIYAIGYRIGMILQFLASIVSLVFFPYAMRIADKPGAKIVYRKIYNYFVWLGSGLGILLIIFSNEIFALLIDSKYNDAINIVFVGVISVFLLGVFNILNIGFYVKKSAKNISITVTLGAILNLVLNYFLIPRYGIFGAGIASIVAYLFIVIYNFINVEIKTKIGFNWKFIATSIILLLITSLLNIFVPRCLTATFLKLLILSVVLMILFMILKRNGKLNELFQISKTGW